MNSLSIKDPFTSLLFPTEIGIHILKLCSGKKDIRNFLMTSKGIYMIYYPCLLDHYVAKYEYFPFQSFMKVDSTLRLCKDLADRIVSLEIISTVNTNLLDETYYKYPSSLMYWTGISKVLGWFYVDLIPTNIELPILENRLSSLTKLKAIKVSKDPKFLSFCIDPRHLSSIAKNCSSLTSLDLSNLNTIPQHAIESISKNCTQLIDINLERSNIPNEAIKRLGENCTLLQTINLNSIKDINGALKSLNNCVNLKNIELNNCDISRDGLKNIANNTNLQSLSLVASNLIADEDISALVENCTRLTHLDISSCSSISNEGIRAISEKGISLKNLFLAHFEDRIKKEGIIAIADNCTSLVQLDLSYSRNLTEKEISVLTKCTSLKNINLSHCRKITKSIFDLFPTNGAICVQIVAQRISSFDIL